MRDKVKEELWRDALRALGRAASEISEMEGKVFGPLKVSYDLLEDPQIKLCFLDCALYPEDYEIDVRQLVRIWTFPEGLVNHAETLDAVLDKGHRFLDKLMDACLLEKGTSEYDETVRMHDLIRDLAIMITSPSSSFFEGQKFLVKAGEGLEEPPEEIQWEGMTKISLMKNQLTEIQVMPNCPELVSLLLARNEKLHRIGDHFFQSMPKLQILDLSHTDIKSLPPSFSMLVKLRVLILRYCPKLKEMPPLEDFKELELLDLSNSGIENLPGGFANLANLKLLDLTYTAVVGRIPPNVISKLTCLQNLRLVSSTDEKVNVDIWGEVATLRRLTFLEIDLPGFDDFTAHAMNHPIWSRLTSYLVRVRRSPEMRWMPESGKHVSIDDSQVFPTQISWIRNVEFLAMTGCKGLERLSQIIGESRTLKSIALWDIEGLKCVIDWREVGEDNALGCLEILNLNGLESLEKVFDGAPRMTAGFGRITEIYIYGCPKLTFVFSSSMLQHLHQLETLWVSDCKELAEIVEGGPFPDAVHLKLTKLKLSLLPKLTIICRQHLVLKEIEVWNCPLLKKLPVLCSDNIQEIRGEIIGAREWWEGMEWDDDDHSKSIYSTILKLYA